MGQVAVTVDYEFDWGGRTQSIYGIEKTIDKVLEIFEQNSAKSTFFISTETVEKTKDIIKKIHKAGHEIASHGHNHNLKYDELSKDELNFEIGTSKNILEDLIGEQIFGFRTPQFRKNKFTEEILLKNEYQYDSSSVNTDFLDRYKKNQHEFGYIKSFPVSTIFNKIPAGLKWINLVGDYPNNSEEIKVIYLHLFDLLSMKDIFGLYNSEVIKLHVLMFYLARRSSLFKTLALGCDSSITLKNNL